MTLGTMALAGKFEKAGKTSLDPTVLNGPRDIIGKPK
jgi:hypothetical protein